MSRVLIIGGHVPTPVGEFSDSMQLLGDPTWDNTVDLGARVIKAVIGPFIEDHGANHGDAQAR